MCGKKGFFFSFLSSFNILTNSMSLTVGFLLNDCQKKLLHKYNNI